MLSLAVKMSYDAPALYWSAWLGPLVLTPDSILLLVQIPEDINNGSRDWVPVSHVGNLK